MSLVGLVGGDARVVDAHDRAVAATLAWIERNAVETRLKDPATGRMVREGGQKMVAATFGHDTSRNLDPQLHTHAVIANMVQGEDGKWRSMANEKLYESKMLIGAIYRSELARGLGRLGYGIEKSTRRRALRDRRASPARRSRRSRPGAPRLRQGMAERGMGSPSDNPRLAERAALVSRAAKRDIDRDELAGVWQRQAADLGFDAASLAAEAKGAEPMAVGREAHRDAAGAGREDGASVGLARESAQGEGLEPAPSGLGTDAEAPPMTPAAQAVAWAVAHLSEREAVFARTDLLAAALAWNPGEVTVGEAEAALAEREQAGSLHAARMPGMDGLLTTDRAVAATRRRRSR